ncbi:MAG TPA: efflux RND transporter periplasmic adaptor subunit [Azospirillum sp.]|nr:efflux RND transporter periplasmic adaptor subunit [Azospirillum sp.]
MENLRQQAPSKRPFVIGLTGVCLAISLLAGCRKEDGAQSKQAAPPSPTAVGVAAVARKDVAAGAEFVGRVVAVDAVDIRARVSGFLEQTLFADGQEVREGDLLFVIEKAPYEAQAAQVKANAVRAEADATNAAIQLQRALELVKNRNISEATLDDRKAGDAMAKATVAQQNAAVQQADINLGYTEIRSPITGRISRAHYTKGSLVGPDAGPLATVVSQDPIYVTFPVSQRAILDFKRRTAGQADATGRAVVRLKMSDNSPYAHPGKVNFLDVRVDQGTDTLTVRAEFPNPERFLVDGQYVSVLVEQEKGEPALTVPQAAIQADQAGTFVLVVGEGHKVEARRVTLGESRSSGEAVVQQGLKAGETVIVQGIQKVRPGQVVEPSPVSQSSGA